MYNLNLEDNEELIEIFENEYVKQGKNEKNTTIAITNKRLLFLDYMKDDPDEVLRIARGVDYIRYKEIYYQIRLSEIEKILKKELYSVVLKDGNEFEFEDDKLFNLINDNLIVVL